MMRLCVAVLGLAWLCFALLCFELQCAAVMNFIAVPGDCAAFMLSGSDS